MSVDKYEAERLLNRFEAACIECHDLLPDVAPARGAYVPTAKERKAQDEYALIRDCLRALLEGE